MAWQSMEALGDPGHGAITTIIRAGRPFSDTSSGHKCAKNIWRVWRWSIPWDALIDFMLKRLAIIQTPPNDTNGPKVSSLEFIRIHATEKGVSCMRTYVVVSVHISASPCLKMNGLGREEGRIPLEWYVVVSETYEHIQLAHRKGIEKDTESTFNSWISGYLWSWKHIWDHQTIGRDESAHRNPVGWITLAVTQDVVRLDTRTPGIRIPHDAPFFENNWNILCYTFFKVTSQKPVKINWTIKIKNWTIVTRHS